MSAFTIDELAIPQSLDDDTGPDFIRAVEVTNEVDAIGYGTPDLAYEPAEELPTYLDPNLPTRLVLARVDGRVVARATYETTLGDDADTAWLSVQVLPEFRRRGIGSALADAVEGIGAEDGKQKVLAYVPVPDRPGARLDSPTGFGSIPVDDSGVRLLQGRGYRLEQIERVSQLVLPVPGIDARAAAAQERSGTDYVPHYWVGGTPVKWLDDMATLLTRMTTDAPSAGLEEPEDIWTAQRIADADERNERMNGRPRVTVAVEHLPTGRLVGFSKISVPEQRHRAAMQYGTLVLREHRGHALGMLMKVGNLAHLERVRPGHPSIITFNAEENRHMLDVNEAVGFAPIANESAWRKDLG